MKTNFTSRLEAYFAAKRSILKTKDASKKDKVTALFNLFEAFHNSNDYMMKTNYNAKTHRKTEKM
jgi:hypothetical protein